ncbi:glycoside hydrolase family 16 protein [Rhizopogon vinicolor AM-OR11-026]|uniref:Glycoside hydrolase family 16 protein n=1 Tax=Rhizopogon vinicolor AM-OR11-026 TaxID=1314800 RepID=A0A1B7N9Z7_9AGAM|nr:glycoside hydrolase family 16 protein [Rhizopogon vinicolor AM-OR11-026]
MKRINLFTSALTFLAFVFPVVQAQQGATCNSTSPCSSTYPCCSEYGFCGDGYYCLGGCNPLGSHTLDSCTPSPICENANYTLSDTSRILSNSTYFNGNASEYDWVIEQGSIINTTSNGEAAIALLLTENGGGTLLSSTRYVHYGQVTARLKTGRWAGVVTAFITMSSIKDEIDWEFPGNQTTTGQSNFFWQGVIPAQTAGVTEPGLTDTFSNWHDFTFDWQPNSLTFLVDGNATRTITPADTTNNATGVVQFPNTPSRIQLSIWPAGISSEPQGTVQWAGGMINWNDPDYISAGHFYALFQSVSVQCNDPTTPNASDTSYVYGTNSSLNTPSIAFSNASTINGAPALIGMSTSAMSLWLGMAVVLTVGGLAL